MAAVRLKPGGDRREPLIHIMLPAIAGPLLNGVRLTISILWVVLVPAGLRQLALTGTSQSDGSSVTPRSCSELRSSSCCRLGSASLPDRSSSRNGTSRLRMR